MYASPGPMYAFIVAALVIYLQVLKTHMFVLPKSAECKVIFCSPSVRAAGAGTERAPLLLHCSHGRAGVERLSYHTITTSGVGAKVSPTVTSSHCSSMTA